MHRARHLKGVLSVNDSNATPAAASPPVAMPPPGAAAKPLFIKVPPVQSRMAYAAAYWPLTLRNLVVKHRLRSNVRPAFKTHFHPTTVQLQRWCATFGLDPVKAAQAPFMYAQAAGTVLYMRAFAAMGLNFRHLLHMDHRSRHPLQNRTHDLAPSEPQTVSARVSDVVALGAGKVVLTVDTEVRDSDSSLRLELRDRFIVRGYKMEQIEHLHRDEHLAQAARTQARRPSKLANQAPHTLRVPVPSDMGRRFARVSGDANPVHTTPWAARLFGHSRPFLQGLATRNLIVGHLSAAGCDIGQLQLHLCRPVLCSQTLQLAHDGREFELLDADARLLACGHYLPATA